MNDEKQPKVRFKGFTDPWEQRKLENIALETYGGGTPTTKKKDFWDGDIPWIQSSNLRVDNLYSVEPGGFLTQDAIQQSAAKIIPKNSIAIVTRVGVGKAALIPYDYSTSQDFLSLSGLKVDIFFAIYSIYRHLQLLTQNLQGTSIKGITKKELLNTQTLIPNNQREQKLIGQYFKVLDNLIAANQDKLDQLKEVKKLLMQKIFDQQWRFSGFTDPWEQRKLGKMGYTFTGLSGKTKEDFGHGNAKFVTYMNVFSSPVSNSEMVENVEVDSKQHQVEYGDVFFTTSSETPQEVGMSSVWLETAENIYLNSFCFGYHPMVEFDPYYLAFMLRSPVIRKKFMLLAQGISRYNISKNKVMEMLVPVPEIVEQQKIGSFFKQLDDTITLHQDKVDQLKEMKKWLMQNMFV